MPTHGYLQLATAGLTSNVAKQAASRNFLGSYETFREYGAVRYVVDERLDLTRKYELIGCAGLVEPPNLMWMDEPVTFRVHVAGVVAGPATNFNMENGTTIMDALPISRNDITDSAFFAKSTSTFDWSQSDGRPFLFRIPIDSTDLDQPLTGPAKLTFDLYCNPNVDTRLSILGEHAKSLTPVVYGLRLVPVSE